nr:polysaccharide deacetylase family protein [Bradyrhizobium sp. 142]
MLHFEHFNWYPRPNVIVPPSVAATASPYPQVPDVHRTSLYEYGNRVGGFRVLDVLRRNGIRPTIAMDLDVAKRCRPLVDQCLADQSEFVGHGLSSEIFINETMSEEVERAYIQSTIQGLAETVGQNVRGWKGSECGESSRTVRLLAELGIQYVCDWPTDEQPHLMHVSGGSIVNLPFMFDVDDLFVHLHGVVPIPRFARVVMEQFDRLCEDGANNGRLMIMNVHPWILGQPFRIRYFEHFVAHMRASKEAWFATAGEVCDAYRKSTMSVSDAVPKFV